MGVGTRERQRAETTQVQRAGRLLQQGFPNVVLVGARASGKSRASRRLAEAVGWTRISTDELLEARCGAISAFVERHGWARFREEERAVLAEISGERLIVDCGGGIVEDPENVARLRQLGSVYWVRAPTAVLRERLSRPKGQANRPSLTGRDPAEEAALVLERRTPLYREAARHDVWSGVSPPPAGNAGLQTGPPSTTSAASGKARIHPGLSGAVEAADALLAAHFGPRLALVAAGETLAELRRALAAAEADAGPLDLIELRFDTLADPRREDLAAILDELSPARRARLLVTVRRPGELGRFRGGEEERLALLAEAGRRGAGYLDLELEAHRESGGAASRALREAAPAARLVASFHDPDGMPAALEALPGQMEAMRPDICKIAVRADGWRDVRRVRSLIREEAARGRRIVGIALGPAGSALRVTAGGAGAALSTYAPPSGAAAVASGQLSAGAIRERHHRWGSGLDGAVPVFGVVGDPIGQSLSPPMQEAAFRRLGLEAAYLAFHVPPDELADFLVAARIADIAGLNVTIPHKSAVIPLLDALDDDARRIGAVNTILPQDGGLLGANTDWTGAVRSLEEVTSLAGRRATVLGAGGSARAVIHGLARSGAEPVVVSRDDRKAAALAEAFGVAHLPMAALAGAAGDILVNTTPVGMAPREGECAAPEATIAAHDVVFDLVFHPERTRLLETAAGLGKRTVSGLRMLILQGAAAFERWTGRPAPVRVMAEAARTAHQARHHAG